MLKLIRQHLEEVFKIKKYDLAIIGGGPVGLFAAHFAHLHGLNTILFDSLSELGGQPQMLYPFKQITDIPAFGKIRAHELIPRLTDGLKDETDIATNHKVENIVKTTDGFTIDDSVFVRSIIIATGAGAFKPKELPLKMNEDIKKEFITLLRILKNSLIKQLVFSVVVIQHLIWHLSLQIMPILSLFTVVINSAA